MSDKRQIRVLEGFIDITHLGAKLSITNGKAQLMAHVLKPFPDVNGDKAKVEEYELVSRPGVARPVAGFKRGEEFGLEGAEIPKGLRHRVQILSGPEWSDEKPKPAKAEESQEKPEPSEAELEKLTAPEASLAAPPAGKRSRR